VTSTCSVKARIYRNTTPFGPVTSTRFIKLISSTAIHPTTGTYTRAQTVSISCSYHGATIRYTTDGSAPSKTNGTIYTVPFAIDHSCLLQVIAYANGIPDSDVQSALYLIENASRQTVWVDDALPAGATPGSDGGNSWQWISKNPLPFAGTMSWQSNLAGGEHQVFFTNATTALSVKAFDTLFCYVYLNPDHPPTEVMLQWSNGGDFEHRAYWGEDDITNWGTNGTASRRYMGPLPATGQWARLSVPASAVGAVGATLNGMAYTLFAGQATFDQAGNSSEIAQ
jgi:hypothetical protein